MANQHNPPRQLDLIMQQIAESQRRHRQQVLLVQAQNQMQLQNLNQIQNLLQNAVTNINGQLQIQGQAVGLPFNFLNQLNPLNDDRAAGRNIGIMNATNAALLWLTNGIRNGIRRNEILPNGINPGEYPLLPDLEAPTNFAGILNNFVLLGLSLMEPALLAALCVAGTRLLAGQFNFLGNVSARQLFQQSVIALALGHVINAFMGTHPTYGLVIASYLYIHLFHDFAEHASDYVDNMFANAFRRPHSD